MHSFGFNVFALDASDSREQNSSVTTIDGVDTVHNTVSSGESTETSVKKLLSSHLKSEIMN